MPFWQTLNFLRKWRITVNCYISGQFIFANLGLLVLQNVITDLVTESGIICKGSAH